MLCERKNFEKSIETTVNLNIAYLCGRACGSSLALFLSLCVCANTFCLTVSHFFSVRVHTGHWSAALTFDRVGCAAM